MLLAQIAGSRKRFAQLTIGLVRTRGPLHGDASLRRARRGETIRMNLGGHPAPGAFQRLGIKGESRGQPEQAEVIVGRQRYTVNDSPQPQVAFSLGLRNLKPSFSPSRA